MTRAEVVVGLLLWSGFSALLSASTRLARPSLAERLRPFHPGGMASGPSRGSWPVAPVREVLRPLARDAGDRLARLFGVHETCELRLRRIHSVVAPATFRARQLAWSAGALVAGAGLAATVSLPVPAAVLAVGGSPVLAFLVVEQRLARASEAWQRATEAELPVVAEQLATLLNTGYSLGSALHRLSHRGQGCVARDVQQVVNRIRQGVPEAEALREWSDRSGCASVERLVGVLSLHSAASDLGRLITTESRQARRDLHCRTVEALERRGEQVWIPVTVATLVPGAILIAVPFMAALRVFANA